MHDDRTTNKNLPLPNRDNVLADDVERIREAFNSIDTELAGIENQISELPENINTKLSELKEEINKQNILSKLGFYIDDEGYLAQKIVKEETPDDPEAPTVLINGKPATLTTKADIQELLGELDFGQ
ncbi:MAG: hypothetical protein IJ859_00095 [Synergistaceae bacterium]|nr:hypothetical protein [Synergistaceae bacterium]